MSECSYQTAESGTGLITWMALPHETVTFQPHKYKICQREKNE